MSYEQEIYNALRSKSVSDTLAKIIVGQARVETNGFTSNVFKVNINAFGMKYPSQRKTPYILGAGSAGPSSEGSIPYARYRNVSDSALDLYNWLGYNNINLSAISTPDAYASALKSKGYFGSSLTSYTSALVTQMKNVSSVLFSSNDFKEIARKIVAVIVLGVMVIMFLRSFKK